MPLFPHGENKKSFFHANKIICRGRNFVPRYHLNCIAKIQCRSNRSNNLFPITGEPVFPYLYRKNLPFKKSTPECILHTRLACVCTNHTLSQAKPVEYLSLFHCVYLIILYVICFVNIQNYMLLNHKRSVDINKKLYKINIYKNLTNKRLTTIKI